MRISVQSNLRQAAARYRGRDARIVRPAAARALTRAAVTGRKIASQKIRARYNLSAAAAKSRIDAKPASVARLESRIVASGERVSIAKYDARENKRTGDVTVRILRGGPRRILKGNPEFPGRPFVAKMKSGFVGVFQRQSKRRLKITALWSVDIPTAMISRAVVDDVNDAVLVRFATEFERELAFRSGRT